MDEANKISTQEEGHNDRQCKDNLNRDGRRKEGMGKQFGVNTERIIYTYTENDFTPSVKVF